MDSNKKDITLEARRLEKHRNEKVRQIEEQLNSSQNDEPTNKGPIQMFQEKITDDFKTIKENLDKKFVARLKYKTPLSLSSATTILLPVLIGILAYFICCFCGQDECYGPVLLAVPLIISKKAFCWTVLETMNLLEKIPCEEKTKFHTELVAVVQDDAPKENLLFWILLALVALLGFLFISALIVGLIKLMKKQKDQTLLQIDEDGNWVYGSKSSNIKQKLGKVGGSSSEERSVTERPRGNRMTEDLKGPGQEKSF